MAERKSRMRQVVSAVLIAIAIAILVTAVIFVRWKKDMDNHPTDKLEAYLEECFYEDVKVSFDVLSYFTTYFSSDMIPYLATVTLADGEELTFCVQWMRDTNVDSGVYADYGNDLVDYYAYKYQIECHETSNWMEIDLEEKELLGENASFRPFFDALWASNYVQSGQMIELYINSDIGHSFHLEMSIEEPIDYETVYKKLTALQK